MTAFKCPSCAATFATLEDHSKHQRCHKTEKNFLFCCGAFGCSLRFGTFGGLDVHLSRQHRAIRSIEVPQLETGNVRCSVDTCFASFRCTGDICHHILREHHRKGEAVKCPLSRRCHCENPIVNIQSHFSKYHKGWRCDDVVPIGSALDHSDEDDEDNVSDREMSQDAHDDSNSTFQPDAYDVPGMLFSEVEYLKKQDLVHNLAKFYIKMESEFILPASTVQSMCEGLTSLLEENLVLIKNRLLYELETLDLEDDVMSSMVNRVMYADAFYAAHDKSIAPSPWLCTIALRNSYYKKHFRYIEPTERDLSFDQPEPTFVYHVPIEETLQVMLACPTVQKEVDESFERLPSDGNVLNDYYDGTVYKEKQPNEKTIDVFIFQDAFKPTNDASPVASKHSTLGMYLSLGNLKPHHRTDLDAIQLVMVIPKYKKIFKDEVLRARCLEVIVADLKKLERDGILYKEQTVKVVLRFLIGDNLGQHEIGGFIGSFSAEYFCRYCAITRTMYIEEPWAREPFRTKEQYEEDMQTATRLNEEDPRTVHYKGVKPDSFECPFNSLENYHVCEPAMPPFHFILENWLDYRQLNEFLQKFSYKGQDSGNKPHEIPVNGIALGGNAVQNWTLLRLLPFLIRKNIKNPQHPHWNLYLSLKEIWEYVFAPSITLEQISYLKCAIENYLHDRIILGFQKPKGHFLNHYADLMVLQGPLRHLWTLRFESVHSYFRRVSRASHNFVNPGKTMTNKHCLYLAYMSTGMFFQSGVTNPKAAGQLNAESFQNPETVRLLLQHNFSIIAEELHSVVVNGIEYKKDNWNGWVLLGNLDEINIHIGEIECIVCDNSDIYILLKTYIGRLLSDYGVFEISNTILSQICVCPQNLKNPCLQSVYEFCGKKCFSLQHILSHDSDYFD